MKSAKKARRNYPIHRIVKVNPLTDARQRVLRAIATYIEEHHYAPSVRDLVVLTSIKSSSNVSGHIVILENAGYLHVPRDASGERLARTMTLTPLGMEQVNGSH